MANYKIQFTNYLAKENINYIDEDEYVVKINYIGENLKSIPVYVIFDEGGESLVEFRCWDIINFKNKEEKGIFTCNKMNNSYRWPKFFIDDDYDVVVTIDSYFDGENCGELCAAMLFAFVDVIDDAYPEFAKAMWA